ncbi:MAG: iron-containing alcohol dehydrogenase [Bradymonadaceae bacterium]|nr:iron-containing alcohol dehydrogenase [Lujinxingiaceae bacterium]
MPSKSSSLSLALIPAAGRGARLDRPATPKPLVDVGGRPIIVDVLLRLQEAGIERAVVVVGYAGAEIVRALTNHPLLKVELTFVEHTGWQQGLASSLLAAREHIDEPFVLAMADHLFGPDLVERIAHAELGDDDAVMLVDQNLAGIYDLKDAVKVGLDGLRVLDLGRSLDQVDGVDAGLFALRASIFEVLEQTLCEIEPADLTDAVRALAKAGKLRAVFTDGAPWHDIDTPSALIHAEMQHRATLRKTKVSRPIFDGATEPKSYRFTTGKAAETQVVIQRGFVKNPERLQLVPDQSASSPVYVFTDTRVDALYGDAFVGGLDRMGYDVRRIVMAEGEESKTLANYASLVERVLAGGIDERSVLISLGGGAVCNVCGFIASTLYRGIGLVHVPTTLMAQCDAAISHKQGVNGDRGKNLVGSYYAPIAIAVDVEVLSTLEDWLIPDGLSEVIKHALGQDPAYLKFLLDYDGSMFDRDFLEHVVQKNIELKCALMAIDAKEHREGMVLQYGHSVGHPVEYLSGYDLNHGQSVAIGMMVAARVARQLGACGDDMIELHRRVIEKFELPTRIPKNIEVADILATMRYNKRYLTEGTRMALIDAPGHLWSVDDDYAIPVSDGVLIEAILASY